MNRNESERRQTKKRNTLSLSEINYKYTMFSSVARLDGCFFYFRLSLID